MYTLDRFSRLNVTLVTLDRFFHHEKNVMNRKKRDVNFITYNNAVDCQNFMRASPFSGPVRDFPYPAGNLVGMSVFRAVPLSRLQTRPSSFRRGIAPERAARVP